MQLRASGSELGIPESELKFEFRIGIPIRNSVTLNLSFKLPKKMNTTRFQSIGLVVSSISLFWGVGPEAGGGPPSFRAAITLECSTAMITPPGAPPDHFEETCRGFCFCQKSLAKFSLVVPRRAATILHMQFRIMLEYSRLALTYSCSILLI
jgi:hypothetical protein